MRVLSLVLPAIAACAGDPPLEDTAVDAEFDGLAIVGSYSDDFGTDHTISEATWTQAYPGYDSLVFHISDYDNVARALVANNDDANAFSAGLWSRFDWMTVEGSLSYCQSAFDAPDEAAAWAASQAGADQATGCGGFPWTTLTR